MKNYAQWVPVDVTLSLPMFLRLYLICRVMLLHRYDDASYLIFVICFTRAKKIYTSILVAFVTNIRYGVNISKSNNINKLLIRISHISQVY